MVIKQIAIFSKKEQFLKSFMAFSPVPQTTIFFPSRKLSKDGGGGGGGGGGW